jgi:hypothetical protein
LQDHDIHTLAAKSFGNLFGVQTLAEQITLSGNSNGVMEDFQCSHIRLFLLIFIADQPVKTSILRQGARHIYPTVEEKHVYEY